MKENEASLGTLGIIVCQKWDFQNWIIIQQRPGETCYSTMVPSHNYGSFLHFALLIAIEHHLVTLFSVDVATAKKQKEL